MPVVKVEDLVPGKIYVTLGGTLVMAGDREEIEQPWGYDRVKFVKKTDIGLIVETPWGSECTLPLAYQLYETVETVIRSEFPLRGVHKSRKILPFDDALKLGICKELTKEEIVVQQGEDTGPAIPVKANPRAGGTVRNDFIEQVITYFEQPKTLAAAAKDLGVKYQKVRYTLQQLNEKGHNLSRFELKKMSQEGPETVQLIKVPRK